MSVEVLSYTLYSSYSSRFISFQRSSFSKPISEENRTLLFSSSFLDFFFLFFPHSLIHSLSSVHSVPCKNGSISNQFPSSRFWLFDPLSLSFLNSNPNPRGSGNPFILHLHSISFHEQREKGTKRALNTCLLSTFSRLFASSPPFQMLYFLSPLGSPPFNPGTRIEVFVSKTREELFSFFDWFSQESLTQSVSVCCSYLKTLQKDFCNNWRSFLSSSTWKTVAGVIPPFVAIICHSSSIHSFTQFQFVGINTPLGKLGKGIRKWRTKSLLPSFQVELNSPSQWLKCQLFGIRHLVVAHFPTLDTFNERIPTAKTRSKNKSKFILIHFHASQGLSPSLLYLPSLEMKDGHCKHIKH